MAFFFLYESSGLTLEAVDVMYRDPNVKPWQSGSYVPPGYSSRYGKRTVQDLDDQTMVDATSPRPSHAMEKGEKHNDSATTRDRHIETTA